MKSKQKELRKDMGENNENRITRKSALVTKMGTDCLFIVSKFTLMRKLVFYLTFKMRKHGFKPHPLNLLKN